MLVSSRIIKSLKLCSSRSMGIDFSQVVKDHVLPTAPKVDHNTSAKGLEDLATQSGDWKKLFRRCYGCAHANEWKPSPVITQKEAISEAFRCAKCVDSPCQKACPTNVNIRSFIYCLQNKNYYGAAKAILSANPMGLSCGSMCPDTDLCASACNMTKSFRGPVKIAKLQEHAMQVFKAMNVPQILSPDIDPAKLPETYNAPIALVGCGPASITCATFLARLGYRNVHVYEKERFPGGTISREIPPIKAPLSDVKFEVRLMQDLGVKIYYGQDMGPDALEALRGKGYKAIFVGCGLSAPKTPLGTGIYDDKTVFNSKSFLRSICMEHKELESSAAAPDCKGKHVMILGLGDTAIDCAKAAFRLGAGKVTVAFMNGFSDLQVNTEQFDATLKEGVNFVPYLLPKKVTKSNDGSKTVVEFVANRPVNNDVKKLTYEEDPSQVSKFDCDVLITAFGSTASSEWAQSLDPRSNVDTTTMQHKQYPDLFFGGDIVPGGGLISHAVNHGKLAAASIHLMLQGKEVKNPQAVKLPGFYTPIDLVDISTEINGKKFINPFGLSSAPPTTSYPMIRRAFQEGWGFAVIKTITLDKDLVTNVSPRIFRATSDPMDNSVSFSNIELVSEKRASYWIKKSKQLKREFPDRVLIGSLMAKHVESEWKELTRLANEGDFDFYELNLSCPHMNDRGMGRACGEDAQAAAEITRWVVSVAKVPVFVKLTPGVHINKHIAMAVQEAGGLGVVCANTMPSLQDPLGGEEPSPAVGKDKKVGLSGQAGEFNRPIAMRIAVEIMSQPGYKGELMSTGGIVSSEHALAYLLYGGAKVHQVCSVVMNQDYTIVDDLNSGLKALLYLRSRKDLKEKGWKGQSPPRDFQAEGAKLAPRVPVDVAALPKIADLQKFKLKSVAFINQMDAKMRVIPEVDPNVCIKCGRCFTACLDSGYQAIEFDKKTHNITVTDRCTGCGLCTNVCPVKGAICLKTRTSPYTVERGDSL